MQSSRGTPFYNASDPYKGCIVSFLVFARAVLLSLPTHSNMRASRKPVVVFFLSESTRMYPSHTPTVLSYRFLINLNAHMTSVQCSLWKGSKTAIKKKKHTTKNRFKWVVMNVQISIGTSCLNTSIFREWQYVLINGSSLSRLTSWF